jgi:hypothetical protein
MKSLFLIAILFILAIYGFVFFFQEKLIFFPETLPPKFQYSFEASFEEVNLRARDGVKLNCLHFKAENTKGVILYFHGNAGSLKTWGYVAQDLLKHGFDVFIPDYRSYGKSQGRIVEEDTLYRDAKTAYDYVQSRLSPKKLVLYGRSIGTSIASELASHSDADLLILESPFLNLRSLSKHHYPFLPSFLLRYEMPVKQFLKKTEIPTLIIHGTKDRIVPLAQSQKLKKHIPRVKLVTIHGAGHNDLEQFSQYHSALKKTLAQLTLEAQETGAEK